MRGKALNRPERGRDSSSESLFKSVELTPTSYNIQIAQLVLRKDPRITSVLSIAAQGTLRTSDSCKLLGRVDAFEDSFHNP
jgi:hypothetical protein